MAKLYYSAVAALYETRFTLTLYKEGFVQFVSAWPSVQEVPSFGEFQVPH